MTVFWVSCISGILNSHANLPPSCSKHFFYAGLYNLLETTVSSCDPPFEIWGGVCYFRYKNNGNQLNWCEAESYCQSHGSNVHLAGMETLQVLQHFYGCQLFILLLVCNNALTSINSHRTTTLMFDTRLQLAAKPQSCLIHVCGFEPDSLYHI